MKLSTIIPLVCIFVLVVGVLAVDYVGNDLAIFWRHNLPDQVTFIMDNNGVAQDVIIESGRHTIPTVGHYNWYPTEFYANTRVVYVRPSGDRQDCYLRVCLELSKLKQDLLFLHGEHGLYRDLVDGYAEPVVCEVCPKNNEVHDGDLERFTQELEQKFQGSKMQVTCVKLIPV